MGEQAFLRRSLGCRKNGARNQREDQLRKEQFRPAIGEKSNVMQISTLADCHVEDRLPMSLTGEDCRTGVGQAFKTPQPDSLLSRDED